MFIVDFSLKNLNNGVKQCLFTNIDIRVGSLIIPGGSLLCMEHHFQIKLVNYYY